MKQRAAIEFGPWLTEQRNLRGWSMADLARKTGMNHTSILAWETRGVQPSTEACETIAETLGLPILLVLSKAGHIRGRYSEEVDLSRVAWTSIARNQIPKEDHIAIEIAEAMVEIRAKLREQGIDPDAPRRSHGIN